MTDTNGCAPCDVENYPITLSLLLMPRFVLPGGSGFLGQSFAAYARSLGHECVILTRHPSREGDLEWDGKSVGAWREALEGAEAVVNFTGKSVNCRHTPENRKEIIDSRVDSVRVMDEAIARCARPPKVIVQAGSLAIYGDTTEPCDEEAPHGEGFGVDVCELWEEAFFRETLPETRKCSLRIGFALGPNGGALVPLRTLTRYFLGGTVGSGRQYISWLHVDDLNRMVQRCIEDDTLEGVFNATGPHPVTNKVFMRAMRKVVGRPWSPPAPAFIVKPGARWILRTEASLALTGRKCYPRRFEEIGFTFAHTDLEATLRDVL